MALVLLGTATAVARFAGGGHVGWLVGGSLVAVIIFLALLRRG